MFKNSGIGKRLGLGFGVVFIFFCALTIFAINRMEFLANNTSQIYNHPLTVSNAVLRINAHIIKVHRSMKDIALDESLEDIDRDSRLVDGFEKEIYADFAIIEQLFLGDRALFNAAYEIFVSWKPVRDEVIKLMRTGKRERAAAITKGRGAQHVVKIENAMDTLSVFARGKASEFLASAQETTDHSINLMYLSLILVVVSGVLFTIYLTRSITRPLLALRNATIEIGQGRLDVPMDIEAGGEIGELAIAFREMASNLSSVTASRDELNREVFGRKRAQESLKGSEERIKLLLDSTAEAIYGLDLEGRCTFANPACLQMLGFENMEDLLGRNMHSLIHHTHADGSPYPVEECHIFAVFQRGEGTHVDDEVMWHRDGTCFESEYWSHPIYEGEKVIGSVVTFMNITERMEIERARQKLLAHLEEKSIEMERFVYTVSHDLKSPLITIQGFLGLLERDLLEGERESLAGDINQIKNAAGQMQRLLEDLLEISRIGRLVNKPERVDFNELVQDAVKLLATQIRNSGVQIDVAADLPMLFGDRIRLLEVVQNLIDNAIKFMGEQPAPHVEIGSILENGKKICYIRDNGMGIKSQYHKKIFELFERLDPAVDGTGIGLAIVKRIIDLEGGRIWVNSEGEGLGCTFFFDLPELGIET